MIAIFYYLRVYIERLGFLWWGIAFGIGLTAVFAYSIVKRNETLCCKRTLSIGLCAGYTVIVLAMAVFTRTHKTEPVPINLDFLGSLMARVQSGGALRLEVVINLLMLVPFGMFLSVATDWNVGRVALVSLSLSLTIEILEMFLQRGAFEMIDIVLNTSGAIVGNGVYALARLLLTQPQHMRIKGDVGAGALVAAYIALKPLYFGPSGFPQVADICLTTATVLSIRPIFESGMWANSYVRNTVVLFAALCLWQGIINGVWSLVLHTNMVKATLYYVFNLLAFIDVLAVGYRIGPHKLAKNLVYGAVLSMLVILVGEVLIGGNLFSTSFFNNPNQLGFHCLIVTTIVFFYYKSVHPALCVAVVVAAAVELFLSASRAAVVGWVVLIVLSLAYCLLAGRVTPERTLLIVGGTIGVCVLLYVVLFSSLEVVSNNTQLANLRDQFSNMDMSYDTLFGKGRGYNRIFEIAPHWLWGVGEGMNDRFETLPGLELHCTYVALLVSYGLVGFVGYAILFGHCVWQKGVIARNLVLLSGILLYQLVHNGIRNTIVWMLLATILCMRSMNIDEDLEHAHK